MANLWLVCLLYSLPGPPKITLDTGTYQLYPVNKRLCSEFDPNRDTTFELYTRNSPNNSEVLRLDEDETVQNSSINFENPTVFFIHGFLESFKSEDAQKIKNNYLERGDYNVILVDTERLVAGPDYITASLNADPIGKYCATFIDFLVTKGLKLSKLHIIGMSLGGQIVGLVGQNLRSGKANRITGLDPAGPYFDWVSDHNRLSKGDAEFVDVIHTNAGGFGTTKSSGDVDIWFNGGTFQPGCDPVSTLTRKKTIAELVLCNHYQAWRIYVRALQNPSQYTAVKCDNHGGKCNETDTTLVGPNVNRLARGNYYIDTGVTAVNV